MPVSSDDRIEELRAEGVELVAGSVTDLAGVTRAKYVPLRRLGDFQRSGMGVSPSWSVFCVDSGIAFTPNIGVDGDLRIRIDPADLRLIDDGSRLGARRSHDQQRQPGAAVHALAAGERRTAAAERGLTACSVPSSSARCWRSTQATRPPIRGRPTACAPRWTAPAFLVDLAGAAERAGLPIEQIHTEYGHDQLEVSLAPRHPVAAADAVILARIVIGRAAARHGWRSRSRRCRSTARRATVRTCTCRWRMATGRCSPAATAHTACGRPASSAIAGVLQTACPISLASTRARRCRRLVSSPATGPVRRRAGVWRTAKRPCGSSPPHREPRTAPTPNSSSSTQRQPLSGRRGVPGQRAARHRPAARACPTRCPKDPSKAGASRHRAQTERAARRDRGAGSARRPPRSC